MGKKESENPSVKKLIKYFTYAAADVGKVSEEDIEAGNSRPGEQAGYSLLWYFENCMINDCDPKGISYSPLLAAYLGLNTSSVLNPPDISAEDIDFENKQLNERFPQSEYGLNPSQIEATHKALHYPVSIIKGPPGTGKTETILKIAALAIARGETVAVVSTNKAAVENVEIKLEEAREAYGTPSNEVFEQHKNEDLAFAAACLHASLGAKDKRAKSEDPLLKLPFGFEAGRHQFANGEEAPGWEQDFSFSSFTKKHRLITCTIHSLKKCFADGDVEKYDLLIMDEASQTNLIVGLVALSCTKRIVIVGDEEQLPPVITEKHQSIMKKYASDKGLFKQASSSPYDISREEMSFLSSCYQVFSNKNPKLLTMLDEHFRCHPDIIDFCNKQIYGSKLIVKSHPNNFDIVCPIRICWYEGDYREGVWPPKAPPEENPNKKIRATYVNRKQLSILEQEEAAHLQQLAKAGKSICILSPFRGQIFALHRSIRLILKDIVPEDAIKIERGTGEEEGQPGAVNTIRALTIHKSQGQEFDTVYLLPVEDGNWEWPWSQGRRLVNVAASRAKEELIVVVSTKLMEKDTQELLSRVTPVKKRARLKDDVHNQEMYVRRLVEHVRRFRPLDKNEDSYYGFHRSIITSIFDDIPWSQKPSKGNKWKKKQKGTEWAPEHCMSKALKRALKQLDDISVLQDVRLSELCFRNGTLVSTTCKDRYKNEEEVHFDFVLFEKETGRVLMAVEVDGVQHRFNKKKGQPDSSQKNMDRIKNIVAKEECGAELCWLGPIHPGSLEYEIEEPESVDGPKDYWPSWVKFPSKVSTQSSFIFLRISSDGSTFWETEFLQQQARENGTLCATRFRPPTIEEYLRTQQKINCGNGPGNAIYVCGKAYGVSSTDNGLSVPSQEIIHQLESSQDLDSLTISACLKKWKEIPELTATLETITPAKMNEALLQNEYHVLEGGNRKQRRPSELGKKIGIGTFKGQDNKGSYVALCYNKSAQDYIVTHLQEILGSKDYE